MPDIPLREQIQCVQRELRMRADVYGRRVRDGKMRAEMAELEYGRMAAVLGTLLALEADRASAPTYWAAEVAP